MLVIDGSASMGRRIGEASPRLLAERWAREFLGRLRPGDSVAILLAGDRVREVLTPPSFDRAKAAKALGTLGPPHSSSDLPAAVSEAFRLLERTRNPERDVIILSDGQRLAWRPGEARRWDLLRDLHRRMPIPPRLWSLNLGDGKPPDGPDGSVTGLKVSRSLVTPGLPVSVSASVSNTGNRPLTRTAELLVDDRVVPGSAQPLGPIPPGGSTPVEFRASFPNPGSHLVEVRLSGGADPTSGDDAAALPVEVARAISVLTVDGEPGLQPLTGETDFLRAALSPSGDEAPQVRSKVIPPDSLAADSLKDQRVLVLANVARLSHQQATAVGRFVEGGGGLLIAPGDRTDAGAFGGLDWLPAGLGNHKGDASERKVVAHPEPRSFVGPALESFAKGEAPALAGADFFAYRMLAPMPGASVSARLDTRDPWVVERPHGKGRVMLLSTAIDAEAGTLPVNPDFVPLVHEWVFHLAGTTDTRRVRPGEPLAFELDPAPPAETTSLQVVTPTGSNVQVPVSRDGSKATARLDAADESGIYRLPLPEPAGEFAYAMVKSDPRESDPAPLEPAEAHRLSEGWPFAFESDSRRLDSRLFAAGTGARREVWRALILAALLGLCLEVYLTRRLIRNQGG
ncbi:VWA domain-containing protein [Singulisphaera sp. PoT]|uniref:VWA domain-containing protein n=1 Tax=Singulisphaera sp. PoT TaxID=3411797 RepID=UPI003BF55AEB